MLRRPSAVNVVFYPDIDKRLEHENREKEKSHRHVLIGKGVARDYALKHKIRYNLKKILCSLFGLLEQYLKHHKKDASTQDIGFSLAMQEADTWLVNGKKLIVSIESKDPNVCVYAVQHLINTMADGQEIWKLVMREELRQSTRRKEAFIENKQARFKIEENVKSIVAQHEVEANQMKKHIKDQNSTIKELKSSLETLTEKHNSLVFNHAVTQKQLAEARARFERISKSISIEKHQLRLVESAITPENNNKIPNKSTNNLYMHSPSRSSTPSQSVAAANITPLQPLLNEVHHPAPAGQQAWGSSPAKTKALQGNVGSVADNNNKSNSTEPSGGGVTERTREMASVYGVEIEKPKGTRPKSLISPKSRGLYREGITPASEINRKRSGTPFPGKVRAMYEDDLFVIDTRVKKGGGKGKGKKGERTERRKLRRPSTASAGMRFPKA